MGDRERGGRERERSTSRTISGLKLIHIRPDLRARFIRSETQLFKHRFESDDKNEKAEFLKSLQLNWVEVDTDEKRELEGGLRRCMGREEGFGAETFFKVCQVFERSEGNRDPFLERDGARGMRASDTLKRRDSNPSENLGVRLRRSTGSILGTTMVINSLALDS